MVGTITETDLMFKYDDARAFLRDNAYPYYANNTTAVSGDWRDKLYLALLHSFPTADLRILSFELGQDSECPELLRMKVKGVLKGKEINMLLMADVLSGTTDFQNSRLYMNR